MIRVEDYDVNIRVSMIVRYLKYKKGYVRKGTSFSFKNYSTRSKYYYKHERKRKVSLSKIIVLVQTVTINTREKGCCVHA